jgi:hypothetical protein
VADTLCNIALGAFVEKFRDGAANGGVALLKANEADETLRDRDTVALLLAEAGNTEADFTSYARKTGLTGTITVDDVNNRVDVDIADQVFSGAGGASNNTLTKLLFFYEESASDAGRIPLSQHEFAITTNGGDITAAINANGVARASG